MTDMCRQALLNLLSVLLSRTLIKTDPRTNSLLVVSTGMFRRRTIVSTALNLPMTAVLRARRPRQDQAGTAHHLQPRLHSSAVIASTRLLVAF